MRKCGRPNLAITRLLVAAFAGLAMLVAAAVYAGLRINTSYSLPLGIYLRTTDPRARLIEFCPVEPFASESSERGYRTHGTCPDGAVPLLKPVVAVAGDRVVLSPAGMSVNGRLLPKTVPPHSGLGRSQPPSVAVWNLCRGAGHSLGGFHLQPGQLRFAVHGAD